MANKEKMSIDWKNVIKPQPKAKIICPTGVLGDET